MACLYTITHKLSGRIYIGWSINVRIRWQNHRSNKDNNYIANAIRKYGKDSFDWLVIKDGLTDDEAKMEEVYWIANRREYGIKLYNLTDGGEGTAGLKISDEAKKKMSLAKIGSVPYNKGVPMPESTKAKIRGYHHSDEQKKKWSAIRRGKKSSEETKRKQSLALIGKPSSNKGKPWSEARRKAHLQRLEKNRQQRI